MGWYPIGESSYGDLRGQMQYVNSERIAQQWLSLVRDFWARFGYRLSPNEARRSRSRQSLLYSAYLRNGYPKAAYPYTSRHDEVLHGNAIDMGVTDAAGKNRALTVAEFAWAQQRAELRGFTWTGRNFGEPWHIEGATRAEHFPPYPGITVGNALGISPLPTPKPKPTPKPSTTTPVGDIVNTFIVRLGSKKVPFLVNPETMRCMQMNETQTSFWKARGLQEQRDAQSPAIVSSFERVSGKGAA